jgi:hypothetical protein
VLCAPVAWANVIYPISHEACTLFMGEGRFKGLPKGHERRSSLVEHRANLYRADYSDHFNIKLHLSAPSRESLAVLGINES